MAKDAGEWYAEQARELREFRRNVLEPARLAHQQNPTPENYKALRRAKRREEQLAYVGD